MPAGKAGACGVPAATARPGSMSLARARARSQCTFRFAPIRWHTEKRIESAETTARRSPVSAGRLFQGVPLPLDAVRRAFGGTTLAPPSGERIAHRVGSRVHAVRDGLDFPPAVTGTAKTLAT